MNTPPRKLLKVLKKSKAMRPGTARTALNAPLASNFVGPSALASS